MGTLESVNAVRTVAIVRMVVVLLASLAMSACAAPAVSMQEGPREYVATDYDDVLERWTRTEDLILFAELERALTVTATFEAWEFRWAYVIRYANDYRLTVAQRQRLLEQSLEETRKSHHFFVALYGGKYRQNDLTKPDGAWIVRLIDSTGNETAPEEITAIKKPSVLERRYYPYNTVWRRSFRVRFPLQGRQGRPTIAPDAEWVGLRFAGAKGNTDLIWEIDQAPAAAATSAGPELARDAAARSRRQR
ncbi:MAG: hypothetical protein JRI23_32030 [Deltaproteobacteria bacterium]|nr:hypothetical protein [Deltaproteobacteria bacterium]MBW2536857.1 hypothetical protein [Deltaproteobacteria bacterium]